MTVRAVKRNILIIEDKADIRLSLRLLLCNHGYEVFEACDPPAATELLTKQTIDLILLDMNFEFDTTSGSEGLAFLKAHKSVQLPIIAMTAWSNIPLAVEAMQLGAKDFFAKPWDNYNVVAMVKKHLAVSKIDSTQASSCGLDKNNSFNANTLLWQSTAMQELKAQVERVAKTNACLFLRGENGTGKSCIAEYVHRFSNREGQFIAVNMGAIPESLFESELFGHKKGAFTDAKQDRVGRFELANSGTLFLDEIATMGQNQQTKLLRVLESKQFERVGDTKTQLANCRIIVASNADFEQMLATGEFRTDLYFRLNTIELTIPPLRDRTDDILPLANHFLLLHSKAYQIAPIHLNEQAQTALKAYAFPGNVRELSHMMARVLLMAEGEEITPRDIVFKPVITTTNNAELTMMTLEDAEKKLLNMALEQTKNNVEQASELLGISKSAIYRRLEKFNLSSK